MRSAKTGPCDEWLFPLTLSVFMRFGRRIEYKKRKKESKPSTPKADLPARQWGK